MSDHTERDPAATLRAILEAIPHPGGLEALDELGGAFSALSDEYAARMEDLKKAEAGWAASNEAFIALRDAINPEGDMPAMEAAFALQAHAAQLLEVLEDHACRYENGDGKCSICSALAATPAESLTSLRSAFLASPEVDAIKRATLEEAEDRFDEAWICLTPRGEFADRLCSRRWVSHVLLGPYATKVKP